ncbi:MAG TPA: hypothetical protein VMJ14_02360 [Burkholderiales bacterium]|nr:hypothetical protein [Burkholderiales bacterium]
MAARWHFQMRLIRTRATVAALLFLLSSGAPAAALPAHPASPLSLSRAEQLSVDLKQGMTMEEVDGLLGEPTRTAFKSPDYDVNSTNVPRTMQWIYEWTTPSQMNQSFQLIFTKKPHGQWSLDGWAWAGL